MLCIKIGCLQGSGLDWAGIVPLKGLQTLRYHLIGAFVLSISYALLLWFINPQGTCTRGLHFVCLSVCLSVADLDDGGLLALQRDMNLNSTTI